MSKYSSDFKLEVIKYYLENNVGYQTAAEHFGIAYSPLSCQETAIHFNLAGDYVVSKWEQDHKVCI